MTFTVANATNCDVFRVFDQDTDDVIEIVNYLLERSDGEEKPAAPQEQPRKDNFWDYV